MVELTQDLLKSQLDYDPLLGKFTWKVKKNRVTIGQVAGYSNRGYVRIKLFQKMYEAHRLAWFYMTGSWPAKEMIDHINGDPHDNRFVNLREATICENASNRRGWSKSGLKGVKKHALSSTWYAMCQVKGVRHYLGSYKTPEQARSAYVEFSNKHHGSFSKSL